MPKIRMTIGTGCDLEGGGSASVAAAYPKEQKSPYPDEIGQQEDRAPSGPVPDVRSGLEWSGQGFTVPAACVPVPLQE
jgi:hypothetical protein